MEDTREPTARERRLQGRTQRPRRLRDVEIDERRSARLRGRSDISNVSSRQIIDDDHVIATQQ
jgi:hypothetical protein